MPSPPDPKDQAIISVPEAGACFGVGRSQSYDLARSGVIPTVRCGKRLWVPVAKFRTLLGLDT